MALSRFRSIERLPGAAHPAVFRVTYLCDCGDDHVGLVAHDDLDYGPIAATPVEFRNLLTGRTEPVGERAGWSWPGLRCRRATGRGSCTAAARPS